MCGLAGIVSLNRQPIRNAQERIQQMTSALSHRGPDQSGTIVTKDGLCALGNTRLSIVDPKTLLKLPFGDEESSVLSFNGEIYNYLEVQSKLKSDGVKFQTKTDTEVLFNALNRYGPEILLSLDGMWAIAYYKVKEKKLLLSRDLMGERHIFYYFDASELIFCSEVKPILSVLSHLAELEFESAVGSLLYNSAPPGKTLIKGIKRLLPGHNLEISNSGNVHEYRYRKLHPEKWFPFFQRNPSLNAVIDQFDQLFFENVSRRIPTDVPFVSTLSGGLDSPLICRAASNNGERQIDTLFGLSTDTPPKHSVDTLDEFQASQITAKKYGTNHHLIRMNNLDCLPILSNLASNCFDGCLDPGTASFEMLAHKIKELEAKVALISDGPDELMGGYPVDRRAYQIDNLWDQNRYKYYIYRLVSSHRLGKFILRRTGRSELIIPLRLSYQPFRYVPIHSSLSPSVLNNILNADCIENAKASYGTLDSCYNDLLSHMDFTQLRALAYASKSLPDHFNLRTDKAFMAASVESRVPYQAPSMVEFLVALPAKFRFGNGNTTKYLLREMVKHHIGPEVSSRSKYGFSAPLWKDSKVYHKMNFDDTIVNADIFDYFPFSPIAKEFILETFTKLIWPIFALEKTLKSVQSKQYT